MSKVIFIHGLPGSGKTTIAWKIKELLNAVHINADWARGTITKHLGFKPADRLKQAQAMACVSRMVFEQGPWVVADLVCPTKDTRYAFFDVFKNPKNDVFSVWMNTIEESRFEDTNRLYQKPGIGSYNYKVDGYQTDDQLLEHAEIIVNLVKTENNNVY